MDRLFINSWVIPFLALLLSSFPGIALAQFITDYQFSANSGTYVPLSGAATPVSLNVNPLIAQVPIGFTFNFAGTNYTDVFACQHGFLSFSANAVYSSQNNLVSGILVSGSAVGRPLLAPLWDAQGIDPGITNTSFETTGTVGSRIFTFQWENMKWDAFTNAPVISYQVKLYEGSNKIEFIYRQEANLPTAGSASIGIAGGATGPGNFLSLSGSGTNPGVSHTTETNTINSRPATGQVYAFTPPAIAPIDVRIIGLAAPLANGCYGSADPVKFTLKNNGSSLINFAASPVTVNGKVRGPNGQNFTPVVINSGTLAPNATQDITVAAAYNLNSAGVYSFNASATIPGDGNPANDSLMVAVTRTVPVNATLPQVLDFSGYNSFNLSSIYPGWYEATGINRQIIGSSWSKFVGLDNFINVTVVIDFPVINKVEWIVGPGFIPNTSTKLRFRAAITAFNSSNVAINSMSGTDDKLQVMVSTDCGVSFNPIYTFDGFSSMTLSNSLTDFEVSLASFSGQRVIIAFKADDGAIVNSNRYSFHIDDIFIGTPPAIDLGMVALQNPGVNACFGGSEVVSLVLKNYGSNPINFASSPAQVQVKVTGPSAATLTTIVNSGTLAPWATQTISLSPAINMLLPGAYNFTAIAKIAGDNIAANDSLRASRQTNGIYPLPQSSGFNGYLSAGSYNNLSTIFPGWYDASGVTPGARNYGWKSKNNFGFVGNVNARVALTSNDANEWLISPKLMPTISTTFQFKVAISTPNGGQYATTYAGMANTDDKVQVMVSTDCGATFNPIYTFDASNTALISNTFVPYSIPLGQYAGQPIIVAIYATDGTVKNANKYDFNIDDIFLGTPSPADIGVTALRSPARTGCFTAAETVKVTIKNFHQMPLDLSATNALVTVKVTGATTATLSAVVNSGILNANDTLQVTLAPTLNMLAPGTYNFTAYTSLAGDTQPHNDTTKTTRTRYPVAAASPKVDFTGFTGANLSAVFPGWSEANGTLPGPTNASAWGARTGLGNPSNVTADLFLHDTWQNDWLIGPTFVPDANSILRFEAAITNFGNLNAHPTGMSTTDDWVEVMVSTDCRHTWTPLYTFNATTVGSLSNVLTPFSVPLSSYSGQEITLAFYGTGGLINDVSEYSFHLDNIQVNTLTGLQKDQANQASVTVFPNPSNGSFEVQLSGFSKTTQLILSTLTGQVVKAHVVKTGNSFKMETTGLAPGIYLLKAASDEVVKVVRVVVQ